jgi:hypothetical protein
MSSNVENTLGTQKKFSPNPQGVYEKRLTSLPITQTSGAGTQESQLARAFGLLGDSLMAEGQSSLERQKKVGIAEADRIARGTSEKDMRDLTAIDILQTYGNHGLSDNPYAVATVEKMRGTYFAARAKDEYNTSRQSEEPAKTADEEVNRFNKFQQEFYGKVVGKTSDVTAFQKGFYENHVADQADFAGKRLGEIETERKQIAQGSIQASLGEVTAKAHLMTPEELTQAVSDVFADTRLIGFTIPERVKLAREMALDLAQSTGDYDKIQAMADKVVIGAKPDGSPVLLGQNLSLHDIQQLAAQRTSQMFGENVQKSIEELLGMTPEETNAKYAEWEKTDRPWFNVMTPYRDNIYKQQKILEQKKLAARFAVQEQQYIKDQKDVIYTQQYQAYIAGNDTDSSGTQVATTVSDLPGVPFQHRNSDGILVNKIEPLTKEYVNAKAANQVRWITNDITIGSDEKARRILKVLEWGPHKSFTDSVKTQIVNAIDSISVDKLGNDANGQLVLPEQVQLAFQMNNVDPDTWHKVIGEEASSRVELIQLLAQANNGDLRKAVGLYAQGRERANDREFTRRMDADVMDRLALTSLSGFQDLQGNDVKINVSLAANRSVMERVETLAKWQVYCGLSPEKAVEAAKTAAQKTHYVWRDTAIPRSIFNSINSPERVKVGQAVLDYYFDSFIQSADVEPSFVLATFDVNRGIFRLAGGGGYVHYSLKEIADTGNKFLSELRESPQGVSLEEARKLQKAKVAIPNPENGPKGLSQNALTNMQRNWEKNTGIAQPTGGIHYEIPSPDGMSISEIDNTSLSDHPEGNSPPLWKILRWKASGNNPYYNPYK